MSGFLSEEQAANFATARVAFQRGKPSAAICGAKTRSGALCRDVPVRGSARCIRHCGPKAAREYRERQRRAFALGRITAAEWHEAEARRARNRLHDRWKKNPWLPGCTLDLGSHEAGFVAAMQARPGAESELAPAVLDWCRWRYRRLQIDRSDDVGWYKFLTEELPRRVMAAGPAPDGWTPDTAMQDRTIVIRLDLSRERVKPFSKRQRPDAPKGEKIGQALSVRGRGRPRETLLTEDEAQALAVTSYRNRTVLAPLLERCTTQREQVFVIRALHEYLCEPGNPAMMRRWHEVVTRLR